MVATFQDAFESFLNMNVPRKTNKVRNEFSPWLSSSVRDNMTKRDKMKKTATKTVPYGQLIQGYVINALIQYQKQFRFTTMIWLETRNVP